MSEMGAYTGLGLAFFLAAAASGWARLLEFAVRAKIAKAASRQMDV
jgi:hypothetical protein